MLFRSRRCASSAYRKSRLISPVAKANSERMWKDRNGAVELGIVRAEKRGEMVAVVTFEVAIVGNVVFQLVDKALVTHSLPSAIAEDDYTCGDF